MATVTPVVVARVLILVLGALVVAPAASAARVLLPGTTYEHTVQFTPSGPVAIHVVVGPRPNGLYALRPVLSNDSIVGVERLTSMQRRLSTTGTFVGTNADFWEWATGRPTGIFMQQATLASAPFGQRSSVGVTIDGALDVRRIGFLGRWRGLGRLRVLHALNKTPAAGQAALFTSAWGPTTPAVPDSVAAVFSPFPTATPNTELTATAVELRHEPSIAIPPGGAVLVARGAAAETLQAEVAPGTQVVVRLGLQPDWPGVVHAVGGGPQIVRDGAPILRAEEWFTTYQLGERHPRTAIGQRADGSIVLVVSDGRRPGYSVGMTNAELAQTMVRFGAVTASALDAGGSSTLAFDGRLLNRPSDPGGERAISTALLYTYLGVFAPAPQPVVSPNGDGVADDPRLRVKLVNASALTFALVAPDGSAAHTETSSRPPGTFAVTLPSPAAEGKWTLRAQAVDEAGQTSSIERSFVVNKTLGFLQTSTPRLFLPPRGRRLGITWQQTRPATVAVTVAQQAGGVVRTVVHRGFDAGTHTVSWRGFDRRSRAVRGGSYVVRVSARNEIGRVQLSRSLTVRRIAGR